MCKQLISIITPSFNSEKYIEECITSVFSQDYPYVEFIIIDGGSTDSTLNIINKYNDKIKWISERDNGMYDAINKGIKISHGDYILYLNSDDILLPNALTLLTSVFKENKDLDMVYADYYRIGEDGEILERFTTGETNFKKLLLYGNNIFSGTMLIKKRFLEKYGYFDSSLKDSADYEMCLRLTKFGKVAYIPEPVAKFRIHLNQLTNISWNQWKEALLVAQKYGSTKYSPLYFRYLFMRGLKKILPINILVSKKLLPFRKMMRRIWKIGK